jgi:uncharacterized protein (DUF1330 family)
MAALRLTIIAASRPVRHNADPQSFFCIANGGSNMRTTWVFAFSILAGTALGAGLIEALHAQGKPQAYVVGEISVTDPEGFAKEFSPLARKALAEAPGYRALVLGGKTVAIEGPAPKTRVVINVFDNLDAAVQAYN